MFFHIKLMIPQLTPWFGLGSAYVKPIYSGFSLIYSPFHNLPHISDISPHKPELLPRVSDMPPRISDMPPRSSDMPPRISDMSPRSSDMPPRKPDMSPSALQIPYPKSNPYSS